MELIFKSAAAALTAAVITLLIKHRNPEISFLISACTVTLILIAVTGFAAGLRDLTEMVRTLAAGEERVLAPVLKCLAIGVVTRFTGDLCRDSAQAAVASAVELAGTVCAASVAMPLLLSTLKMIGGLV